MNTIGSHSSLGDLVSWNTSSTPATTKVDAQAVQNTINQVPTQIVSGLAPDDSYYGIAPTTDSLLGNIGTSSALNALSQINATRTSSSQISPYGSASDAVADAQQAQQTSTASILASAAGLATSIAGGSANAIPSAYYASKYSAILSALAPNLTFSSSTSATSSTTGVTLPIEG